MGIFRVAKDTNYSIIHNIPLHDSNLSWRARGLLAYMLSLPDDWTFHVSELSEHTKDSEKITASIVKELKEAGYLKRYPVQNTETGKISHWETVVYEVPTIDTENHPLENPPSGKTIEWETTRMENHTVEKGGLLNTNDLLSTNIPSTNLTKDDDVDKHPLIDEAFQKSYQYVLQNNIPLSETALHDLGEFCDALGSEMVLEAVDRAIDQNVKRWKYISGILSNWQKSNVKTMSDVMQLDEAYKNQKGGGEHAAHRRRNGGNYQAGRSYEEEVASRERNMPSYIKRV
ncbi:DnaD domain protein [Bacillus sp. FDAARGOS_1420]|uniref:DnaD domain protein n=1 Tax=unclassified Bacillus (in: firmicutes) TaxID=185979 RepID=UPI001C5B164B|nr:DnaD domain protein [Bacillus sp. FDAARGOS_1420]MBW3490601.1 DnaD domain protein [Bacillus sp. FDAARGOS_1420]